MGLFRLLSESKIQELLDASTEIHLEQGDHLFKEGESTDKIYVIIRGSGREYSNKQPFEKKRWKRQVLSAQNIIFHDKLLTSFIAEEDMTFIAFKLEQFLQIQHHVPDFHKFIWKETIINTKQFLPSLKPLASLRNHEIEKLVDSASIKRSA